MMYTCSNGVLSDLEYSDTNCNTYSSTTSSFPTINTCDIGSKYSCATIYYSYNGMPSTYVVPLGITQIQIEACGGKGGDDSGLGLGGYGGFVNTIVTVIPQQQLYVYVGGSGQNGGYNGGGKTSGGGGGTDIRTADGSSDGSSNVESRIAVAGGGNTFYQLFSLYRCGRLHHPYQCNRKS